MMGEENMIEISNQVGEVAPLGKQNSDQGQNWVKRAVAAAVIGALLFGAGGAVLSPAEAKADTAIVTEGTAPSEAGLEGYKLDSPATTVTLPNSETTPSILDLVTPEYIQETRDLIMNYESPIPAERIQNVVEAWSIKTFGPYEEEFRKLGATDENRIKFGGRLGYAYEYEEAIGQGGKFQNSVTWNEITNYVLGKDDDNVLCDKDGIPICWMVGMTDKMKAAAREAITWYESNSAADIGESLRNNGVCYIFTTIHSDFLGPDSVAVTRYGGISPNMNAENIKMFKKNTGLRNAFIQDLWWEPSGIVFFQVVKALDLGNYYLIGPENLGYVEVVKSLVSGYAAEGLKGKDKDGRYKMYSDCYIQKAADFRKLYGGEPFNVKFDDKKINRMVEVTAAVYDPPGTDSLYSIEAFTKVFAVTQK